MLLYMYWIQRKLHTLSFVIFLQTQQAKIKTGTISDLSD